MIITFETTDGQTIRLVTAHIVSIIGKDEAQEVGILTTPGVVYQVKQDPERPVWRHVGGIHA